MKYITKILGIACMALSFFACSEDRFEVFQPMQSADDVSYSINFSLQLQEPVTRSSYVYGEDGENDKGVQTMQLLCFDASGLYLGIRTATLGATGVGGTITGTVPQGTAHIHFVANRKLSIPLDFSVGTPEADVMKDQALSTMYDFNAICYWGYKGFDSAEAMDTWLNGQGTDNTVYMIRDRAKIKLTLNKLDQIIENATVTEVKWRIHNGRTSGYIAPNKSDWIDYTKTTTGATPKIVSKAKSNDNGSKRYSIKGDAEKERADLNNVPQYLFDDNNEPGSDYKGAVKVILQVKYTSGGTENTKYFATLIKGQDDKFIPIIRNYVYNLHVTTLDMDVAYDTWDAACDGTLFANGEVDIDRNITDVNNDDYSLQIKLPSETTSIVLNMVTPEGKPNTQMQFAIGKLTNDAEDPTVADVSVHWEHGISPHTTEGGIESYVKLVDINQEGNLFTVPVNVSNLPKTLQNDWLVVEFTKDDKTLRRFIHVYVINQFKFLTYPTLKKETNGDYKLSFQIPPTTATNVGDPMYPDGLYPIDVMFATSTLKAWSIDGSTPNYGLFGVSKESTNIYEDIVTKQSYNLFASSAFEVVKDEETGATIKDYTQVSNHTTKVNWWYQPNDCWDYWYTYSIKQYPTGGVVNIFFKDVRSQLQYANVGNVGLYLYVRYFGKIYGMNVTPTNNNP